MTPTSDSVFSVSIEELDGEFHICPLGEFPNGFMDIGGFGTAKAAEAWLRKWAEQRKLTLEPLQSWGWRVSPSLPKTWIVIPNANL